MYGKRPPRREKPDRLDNARGTPDEPRVKAEFAEVRLRIKDFMADGSFIRVCSVTGEENPRWQYRDEAAWIGVDADDLKAVLRRLSYNGQIRFEVYEWAEDGILKGRIDKYYVWRHDAKSNDGGRLGRTKAGGSNGRDIQPEWDGGAVNADDIEAFL